MAGGRARFAEQLVDALRGSAEKGDSAEYVAPGPDDKVLIRGPGSARRSSVAPRPCHDPNHGAWTIDRLVGGAQLISLRLNPVWA